MSFWSSRKSREQWKQQLDEEDKLGEDFEYDLAPPNCKSRDEMQAEFIDPDLLELATNPPEFAPVEDKPRFQFSLWQVLLFMTFASIGLAAARWLPHHLFTFLAGLGVLWSLWFASRDTVEDPTTRAVLVGAVTVYIALLAGIRLL